MTEEPKPDLTLYECHGWERDPHWSRGRTKIVKTIATDHDGYSDSVTRALCPPCLRGLRAKLEPRHEAAAS